MGAALLVDGVGAAREDDALGGELELGEFLGARQHLREDIELAETAGDPCGRAVVSVCRYARVDAIAIARPEIRARQGATSRTARRLIQRMASRALIFKHVWGATYR